MSNKQKLVICPYCDAQINTDERHVQKKITIICDNSECKKTFTPR